MLEGTAAIATGQFAKGIQVDNDIETVKRVNIKLPGESYPASELYAAAEEEISSEATVKPSEEQISKAVETANDKYEFCNTRFEYAVHEKMNAIMIKIYKDDKLVKEIPPEKILDMVAGMLEIAGLLVDEKA